MSSLIVEVATIDQINPHTNADSLELAIIKGWQCVVPKGKYVAGDRVVYVPVDSLMPPEVHEPMGITKYLSNGRVRCAKLRGEPSFGVVMPLADATWETGRDVAAHYGITKYTPPTKLSAGDAASEDAAFCKYTDIENLRNFHRLIADGEEVVCTEKIHGTNCRVGIVRGEWMAGSRELRRQTTSTPVSNIYWYPTTLPEVRAMLESLVGTARSVVLYGEVYGSKIQNLSYGKVGVMGFSAFDLMIDGVYVDSDAFYDICDRHGVHYAPVLYRGPFSIEAVRGVSGGNSVVGGGHIREGVVVRPTKERTDPKVGRVILKYLNDDYLLQKESGRVSDTCDV
jgi:RNA ligase (TIGR02306 family)